MAPEIDWTRSLKNKLHIWRGSKRRPKSIKKIPVLSPAEYRHQWPFLRSVTYSLQRPFFVHDEEMRAVLEGYADEIEENFGKGVQGDSLPDPIYDALLFGLIGFISLGDIEVIFPKTWFAAGPRYVLDVVVRWYQARELVSDDVGRSNVDWAERALLTKIRKLWGALGAKDYEDVRAYAGEIFTEKGTSLATRAHLAYLFPDQMEWGNAVIDALPLLSLETTLHGSSPSLLHTMMLASGADVEHLEKLIELFDVSRQDPAQQLHSYHLSEDLSFAYSLLDRFEEGAQELLRRMFALPWEYPPITLIEVSSHIPKQEAFDDIVALYKERKDVSKKVDELLRANADFAFIALSKAKARGEMGACFDEMYADLLRTQQRLVAESEDTRHFASRDDFTGILADPPWHGEAKGTAPKPKKIPKALKSIGFLEDVVSFRDPDKVEEGRAAYDAEVDAIDFDAPENKLKKERRDGILAYLDGTHGVMPRLATWDGNVKSEIVERLVEKLPDDFLLGQSHWRAIALSRLLPLHPERFRSWLEELTDKEAIIRASRQFSWAGFAPKIAELLGTKTMREDALGWIEANPREAALGAVPAYFGARGARKRQLGEMLRGARKADEDVFDEVVDAYAEKHGEELRDFLPDFEDAATAYPKKMPSLPVFWHPAAYPPILLEKDLSKRIPVEICDDIALMLKFSPPGNPYIGLKELEEQVDAISLGDFIWGVFGSWKEAGASLDEEWVLRALALFGGPQVAGELPYMLESWLRGSYYKRSEKIIDAISPGCNEYTLEALWRYLHGGHERGALELTRAKLRELFQDNACTDFEPHFDRAAPTFGIGKDHRIKLGGASGQGLKVWLDEDLEPHLSDSGAGFDELDEPIRLRWERLGRLCAWQARFQSRRFERAMRTQRTWSIEDWQNDILEHPLLGMLAQKLLWGVYQDGELVNLVRVDEEDKPVDVNDEPLALEPTSTHSIQVVHPLLLSSEQQVAWTQVFSDYEIIQPFEQLARQTWDAREAEALIKGDLARFDSTLGALQQMFEEHDWYCPVKRKRSRGVPKLSRDIKRSGTAPSVSATVKLTGSGGSDYYPGTTPDASDACTLEVMFGTKHMSYRRLSEVDLSELVWELSRAMRR